MVHTQAANAIDGDVWICRDVLALAKWLEPLVPQFQQQARDLDQQAQQLADKALPAVDQATQVRACAMFVDTSSWCSSAAISLGMMRPGCCLCSQHVALQRTDKDCLLSRPLRHGFAALMSAHTAGLWA